MMWSQLDVAAAAATLLVASDYDGTLAPIVDDPSAAHVDEAAIEALRALAGMRGTRVAVISGRARSDLERFVGLMAGVILIGGHGADWGGDEPAPEAGLLAELLQSVADEYPGAVVEPKQSGAAFHYRHVDRDDADQAVEAALAVAAEQALRILPGKKVIEFMTSNVDKGWALQRLRRDHSPEVTVFIGDDVTDEDAFSVLGESDLGVKVGDGDTVASFRIADQGEVAGLLRYLGERRRA